MTPVSDEQIRQMKELHEAGTPHTTIADLMGVRVRTVYKYVGPSKYRMLKSKRPPITQQEEIEMQQMVDQGISYEEIGKRFNCTPDCARKHTTAPKARRRKHPDVGMAQALWDAGRTIRQIHDLSGIPIPTLYKIVDRTRKQRTFRISQWEEPHREESKSNRKRAGSNPASDNRK